MKKFITIFGVFALLGGLVFGAGSEEKKEAAALEEILALESGTYETWYGESDPTAYAELFANKATIWDAWSNSLIEDGAVKEYLMAFAGQIPIVDYEILNPRVDLYGDTAVFVFNVELTNPKDGTFFFLWKSTAVFTRTKDSWERVHSTFSSPVVTPE
jgi:hypothetical protein